MKRGFSIAEIAIVFVIMAALFSIAVASYRGNNDVYKTRVTLDRFEAIEKAIAAFVAKYNRIPCPASLITTYAATNSGIEYCYIDTNVLTFTATSPAGWYGSSNDKVVMTGSVPVVTLGLPMEYQADPWGNRIYYTITRAFAGASASATFGTPSTAYKFENTNMGLITLENTSYNHYASPAVYVLFSTGPNGLGGEPVEASGSGSRNTVPTNLYESYNYWAYGGSSYYTLYEYTGGPSSANTYDDIIHFKTKAQLVREAGAVMSNQICVLANTILNTQDSSFNSYYYDPNCSYRPYDYRCTTFMQTMALKVRELCLNPYY